MTSRRIWTIVAALSAAVAVPAAFADSKDELAEGDWTGVKKWEDETSSGTGSTGTTTPTTPPTGSGGATTPPPTGDGAGAGTPTEPTGGPTAGPTGGDDPDTDPAGLPGAPAPEPSPPPTTPALPSCNAKWNYKIEEVTPELYEEITMLTVILFRTDAYAFISNGYCRSESTWYVDWFARTQAKRDGFKAFKASVFLEHACPNCKPRIELQGISMLEAKAQVKTSWGSVNGATSANSMASTCWAGDLQCSDGVSAAIVRSKPEALGTVTIGPIKATIQSSDSCIYVEAPGGISDSKTVLKEQVDFTIVNKGSVATDAGGTEDNAQAKSRAGFFLKALGKSTCGPRGELQVEIKN